MLPNYFITSRIKNIHAYGTRNKDDLYLDGVKKSSSINSLFYKGIREFNALPST